VDYQAHGSEIYVESEPEKGSVFYFKLKKYETNEEYVYIISIITILLLYAGQSSMKIHAQKTIIVVSMTADEMSSALKNGTISGYVHGTTSCKAVIEVMAGILLFKDICMIIQLRSGKIRIHYR